MKIRFKGKSFPIYNHPKFSIRAGETVEIENAEAERILRDFPDDFEIIMDDKIMKPPQRNKMHPAPDHNRNSRSDNRT